jgi:hypothetical protein
MTCFAGLDIILENSVVFFSTAAQEGLQRQIKSEKELSAWFDDRSLIRQLRRERTNEPFAKDIRRNLFITDLLAHVVETLALTSEVDVP